MNLQNLRRSYTEDRGISRRRGAYPNVGQGLGPDTGQTARLRRRFQQGVSRLRMCAGKRHDQRKDRRSVQVKIKNVFLKHKSRSILQTHF